VLDVRDPAALGAATNAINVNAGGQLLLNNSGFWQPTYNLSIAGVGPTGSLGALRFTGSSAIYYKGGITLTGDATIWLANTYLFRGTTKFLDIGANRLTLVGNIGTTSSIEGAGIHGTTGGVYVDLGSGDVGITADGTYTGPTTIHTGTVFLQAANGFGVGTGSANAVTVDPSGQLTLNSGSYTGVANKTLVLNGGSFNDNAGTKSWGGPITQTAASTISAQGIGGVLTLTGGIDNGGFALTLKPYFDDSVINVNAAGITGPGGLLVPAVTGKGAINLNAWSDYSGGTTINSHRVYANATGGTGPGSATGTGPVTVNNGGLLGGSGVVAGEVTVNSGGTVAPGTASATGNLTVNSGVTFVSGSKFNARFPSVSGFDSLTIGGGAANLGNSTLTVNFTGLTGSVDPTAKFYIVQTTGAGAVQFSTFNGLPDSALVATANGYNWFIRYDYAVGGVGGDVYLTAVPVPEPGLILAAGAVAVGGAGFVRRLRRPRAA
jgi:fibronectin-binding autotransporter adhesin